MAKFCTQCGRPLKEGEICECQLEKNDKKSQDNSKDFGETKKINKEDIEKERIKANQKSFDSNNSTKENISYNNEENSQHQRPNREEERRYYNNNEPSNEKNFMDDLSYWQGRFQEKVGTSFREKVDGFKEMNDEINRSNQDLIVPNRISPAEGEIPIKQYDIAIFKNLFWGFLPYSKANCKMLVSNKRLLLSAKGLDLKGEMNYQNEFSINEISGIDFVQGFMPNFFRFLIGLIITIYTYYYYMKASSIFGEHILLAGLVFLALGVLATILIKKNNLLQILAAVAINLGYIFVVAHITFGDYISGSLDMDSLAEISSRFTVVYSAIYLILFLYLLFRIWMFAQIANLKIVIQTKPGLNAINIEKRNRKLFGLLDDAKDMNTGFTYIVPAKDTELARRELGSIIKDIQNLGEDAIGKWKNI